MWRTRTYTTPNECYPERASRALRDESRGTLRFTFLLTAALIFISAALAQNSDAPFTSSKPKPTQRVTTAPIGLVRVAAGASKTVELPFRVARGYHINSNKPASELLLPTALSISPPTNIAVAGLTYPKGEVRSFPFSPDEKLNVYSGDFTLTAVVRPARNTPLGTYRVKGTLKYQACDNRACYPPGQVPVAFDVKVTKGASVGRKRRNPAQSPHVHQ